MSEPEPKPDPKAPPKGLIVTKASAAKSQLESAIVLWFNYGDPVSICALAYAAHDCYAALSAHIGKPSLFKTWFALQPKRVQKRILFMLSFFKHGPKELKGRIIFPTVLGEVFIADSIQSHQRLFGKETLLMSFFATRFGLEHPLIFEAAIALIHQQSPEIYEIIDGDRTDFLNKALERLRIGAAGG